MLRPEMRTLLRVSNSASDPNDDMEKEAISATSFVILAVPR